LASNPDLDYADVKALILNNVDPLPELEGKMVSGGRLNVFKALSTMSATPLVLSAGSIGSSQGSDSGTSQSVARAVITTRYRSEPERTNLLLLSTHDIGRRPGQSQGMDDRIAQTSSAGSRVAGSGVNGSHAVDLAVEALFAQIAVDNEPAWFQTALFRRSS
jgi:hypothetical protein